MFDFIFIYACWFYQSNTTHEKNIGSEMATRANVINNRMQRTTWNWNRRKANTERLKHICMSEMIPTNYCIFILNCYV